MSETEAHDLFATFAVPGSGVTLFQAAAANFNPWTEAKVDTQNPGRGHSLTIDHGWREVADIALAFVQKHAQSYRHADRLTDP